MLITKSFADQLPIYWNAFLTKLQSPKLELFHWLDTAHCQWAIANGPLHQSSPVDSTKSRIAWDRFLAARLSS